MIDLKVNKYNKNILAFAAIFVILYSLSFLIDDSFARTISQIGNAYFEKTINSTPRLNRHIEINNTAEKPTEALVQIIYYDKKDSNGDFIVKTIGTDIRREALISTIFLTSLIFSFPLGFKNNIKKYLVTLLILYLFIFFKLYVFVFDNYNYPEYSIMELPTITSFFVYWGTFFFNAIGSNTNVMVPVLLWFGINIRFWIKEEN